MFSKNDLNVLVFIKKVSFKNSEVVYHQEKCLSLSTDPPPETIGGSENCESSEPQKLRLHTYVCEIIIC